MPHPLTQLLAAYPDALSDRRRFCALLRDTFPRDPMTLNLLTTLYTMGISQDIAAAPEITDPLAYRYQKRLTDEYGVSPEKAREAVAVWCLCYGREVLGKPCNLSQPQTPPASPPRTSPAPAPARPRPAPAASGQYNDQFQYRRIPGGWAVTGFSGVGQQALILPDRRNDLPVLEIAASAFAGCAAGQVIIVGSVAVIREGAFRGSPQLRQVILSATLTEIGESAFRDCPRLTDAALPAGVRRVGAYAFAGTALQRADLPGDLASLGEGAFLGCASLTRGSIPAGISRVPERLFSGCGSLTGVSLPEGLAGIGEAAFEDCAALESLAIPGTVTAIGPGAFAGTHPGFRILCPRNSAAERYARENRIPFQII